ncbi:class I SAM-dependent methyltransferase [Streptomyces huiliensis]|uniref:class I SAM-dependent methyltransferase n=1 Tax=Streptomyces huiliensis TaxID=2876027 RepID=UPI001CC0A706|nr:class I SAM-dependent methyltransferase [Streptomyces huiliensis]MBZ4320246.1 class I SAM-dependent methyltransferase [Streptomyces huiliensis]
MARSDVDRTLRKVFGEAVEEYDAGRPAYPDRLFTDVLDYARRGADGRVEALEALEVGAGTGKATLAFAAHGVRVTAVEPDPRMAAALARHCAGDPGIIVEEGEFETWDPAGRRFGLLFSAQAWHWIDPETGWSRARSALRPGGTLAIFRNDWYVTDEPLRHELTAVHDRFLPERPSHSLFDEPPSEPDHGEYAWVATRLRTDPGFTDPAHRVYTTSHTPTTTDFTALLTSLSFYRVQPPDTRRRLLTEVARIVGTHGGHVDLTVTTGLFLARTTG